MSNSAFSVLKNLKAKKSSANVLEIGDHIVRVAWYKEIRSSQNYDGSHKEQAHEWDDDTPQILTQFVSEDGVMMHRFNLLGYKRFEEFTDEEIKKRNIVDVDGFAAVEKNEKLLRIKSKERTERALSILQDFMYKLGADTWDDVETAVSEKKEVKIRVVENPYQGKPNKEVQGIYEVTPSDEEQALADASVEELE